MGCPDWHTAMHSLRLQRLLWIYCPGHAGVSGNERADRLASTADIKSGLQLGRAEVLRGFRNFLSTDKPEHHSIDRLKERGVEKGSGRHSTLQGRERSVFNQTNIGTVSRTALGRLLRDGAERVWAFPSATMPSWAETETETGKTWNSTLRLPAIFSDILITDDKDIKVNFQKRRKEFESLLTVQIDVNMTILVPSQSRYKTITASLA